MAARLLGVLLWLLSRLPLRRLQPIGALLGRWWYRRNAFETRIARRNLELCLPEMSADEREQLTRASLIETGRGALELAWIWYRPLDQVLAKVHTDGSEALLQQAIERKRPLIIAAPHLGAWEVLNLWIGRQMPLAILYRPPRQRWLESLLNRVRARIGAEPVPATRQGVRRLVEVLNEGKALGILPDQQPKQGEGEFAPFFGQPALTMTLLPKLASRFEATVLFVWAERLADGAGWVLRFRASDPVVADAAGSNANVEGCVRRALAQYQWTYRRFAMGPEGVVGRYHGLRGAPSRRQ
jgi:KDO2-lipid IV(A) lauroyltransferase